MNHELITMSDIKRRQQDVRELFGQRSPNAIRALDRLFEMLDRYLYPIHVIPMTRPTIDEVMLRCAYNFSHRSTCTRRRVGCVITTHDRLQILGVGYNGNAKGLPNVCDRDTPGDCGCIHAELNALLKAPGTLPNKVLYTTTAPCLECAKLILNSNIIEVIYGDHYRNGEGLSLLIRRNVLVRQLTIPPWRVEPGAVTHLDGKAPGVPFEP